MSFYTSATYYRPAPPPRIDGSALADFLQGVRATGVVGEAPMTLRLRFGRRIDANDRPATWIEWRGMTGVTREIKWHVDEERVAWRTAIDLLRARRRTLYRAFLMIGGLTDSVTSALHRPVSPENEVALTPDSVSLELGPITVESDDTDFHVGWIGLGISGYGYLFPWTIRDYIERLSTCPELARLMEHCRTFWPVEPVAPTADAVRGRAAMGKLWGGDDFDAPLAWRWAVQDGV